LTKEGSARLVTVLADDLTGALDTAVQFAREDSPVTVLLRPHEDDARVVVADTESRGLSPAAATRSLQGWIPLARGLVYKKMDSTLRGPFAAEAEALGRALGKRGVLVAPAFPRAGRTVRQGVLHVHGIPVHETEAAADPGCPITDSRVREAVRRYVHSCCHTIGLPTVREGVQAVTSALDALSGFAVADAETDADLAVLAKALVERSDWLPCGSAGLAEALAGRLGFARSTTSMAIRRPAVLVVGSAHPASRRQLARVAEALDLAPVVVGGEPEAELLERADRNYHRTGVALLALPEGRLATAAAESARTALARLGAELVDRWRAETLYATGGETLLAVLEALDVAALRPLAEVAAGVVISEARPASGRGLAVVSKAGGFGDDDLLVRLFATLPVNGTG